MFTLAALGAVLSVSAAQAGGSGCATCYQKVVHPPVYGTQHEKVMIRAPRTVSHVVPAKYETVAETVMVQPASKVWQVSHDAHGREIGCWVKVPARYETRHRQVLVQPETVVPVAIPAVYGHVARPVLLKPAHASWQPVSRPAYKPAYEQAHAPAYYPRHHRAPLVSKY